MKHKKKNIMKHVKLLATTIVILVTFYGCQKEELLNNNSNTVQTLTACAPGQNNDEVPDTKISFEEDNVTVGQINLAWQVGDVITIYENGDTDNRVGDYKVSQVDATTGKATFVHQSGNQIVEDQSYNAVYPASTITNFQDWSNEEWWKTHLSQNANNSLDHLDDNLRMCASFVADGSVMSFEHQTVIMSVTFESSVVPTTVKIVDTGNSRTYTTNLTNFSVGESIVHFLVAPTTASERILKFVVNRTSDTKIERSTSAAFEAGKHYQWDATPPSVSELIVGYWEATEVSGEVDLGFIQVPISLDMLKTTLNIDLLSFQFNSDGTAESALTSATAAWLIDGDQLTLDAGSSFNATFTIDELSESTMTLSCPSLKIDAYSAIDVVLKVEKKTKPE